MGPRRPGGAGRRRRRTPALLALLTLLAAGGAWGWAWLDGGGPQPAAVLPGDAVAYVAVDTDPPARQKLAALQLLRSLPDRDGGDGGEGAGDLRRELFERVAGRDDVLGRLDWADVEPWLGDRLGLALRPPPAGAGSARAGPAGEDLHLLAALQVRDEGRARRALADLARSEGASPGIAFSDGYAVLALDQAQADDAVSSARSGALQDAEPFASDVGRDGTGGLATAWADVPAVVGAVLPGGDAEARTGGAAAEALLGSTWTASLRATDGVLELAARTRGGPAGPGAGGVGPALGELPASTALAVGGARLGPALASAWRRLARDAPLAAGLVAGAPGQRTATERQLGLDLPRGLEPLLGEDVAVAVLGAGDAAAPPPGDQQGVPAVAVRVRTPDAGAAARALDLLLPRLAPPLQGALPERVVSGDELVAGRAQTHVRQLRGGSDLGASARFRAALPGLGGADVAAYADLDALPAVLDQLPGRPGAADARRLAEVVDVAGLTVTAQDGGLRTVLRLVPEGG